MRIIRTKDYDQMSRQAANIISAQVILKPDSVLGLATGSSPIGTYQQLIDWNRRGDVDFSAVRTVNLDEYEGMDMEDEQSYIRFMYDHFLGQINIDPANTHIPNGKNTDSDAECRRYDELIRSLGGIDLQLLGMGPNGHIGFNEPAEWFEPGTHRVCLTRETIQANKRFFEKEEDVPRFAYTMGIVNIMQADRILMVVSGKAKAPFVRKAFREKITPMVPASILQVHKDFTLVADEEALSLM